MSGAEFGDWAALYALERQAGQPEEAPAEDAPDLKAFMRQASG